MKHVFISIIFVFLFIQLFFLQNFIDTEHDANSFDTEFFLTPSPKMLTTASLGFNGVVADVYWLKTLHYFGTHFGYDHQYPYLDTFLNIVTTLDPYFKNVYKWGSAAYLFSGNNATYDDKIKSINLLKKALIYYPNDWDIIFQIGFNYAIELRDYDASIKYISEATTQKDCPEQVKYFLLYVLDKAKNSKDFGFDLYRLMVSEETNMIPNQNLLTRARKQFTKLYGALDSKTYQKLNELYSEYVNDHYTYLPFTFFMDLVPEDE